MRKTLITRLFNLLVGAVTAKVAGVIFGVVWKAVVGESEAPHPGDPDRGLGEVIASAVAQGAIFGLVQVLLNRGGAAGIEQITGERPGA